MMDKLISLMSQRFTKTFSKRSGISYNIYNFILFILNILFLSDILFMQNSVDLKLVSSAISHLINSILKFILIKSALFFLFISLLFMLILSVSFSLVIEDLFYFLFSCFPKMMSIFSACFYSKAFYSFRYYYYYKFLLVLLHYIYHLKTI